MNNNWTKNWKTIMFKNSKNPRSEISIKSQWQKIVFLTLSIVWLSSFSYNSGKSNFSSFLNSELNELIYNWRVKMEYYLCWEASVIFSLLNELVPAKTILPDFPDFRSANCWGVNFITLYNNIIFKTWIPQPYGWNNERVGYVRI